MLAAGTRYKLFDFGVSFNFKSYFQEKNVIFLAFSYAHTIYFYQKKKQKHAPSIKMYFSCIFDEIQIFFMYEKLINTCK